MQYVLCVWAEGVLANGGTYILATIICHKYQIGSTTQRQACEILYPGQTLQART